MDDHPGLWHSGHAPTYYITCSNRLTFRVPIIRKTTFLLHPIIRAATDNSKKKKHIAVNFVNAISNCPFVSRLHHNFVEYIVIFLFQLPDIEGLTKEEMYRRPTSDVRQRRIAHVPRYPPVNKKRGKYLLPAPEEPKDKEDPPKKITVVSVK